MKARAIFVCALNNYRILVENSVIFISLFLFYIYSPIVFSRIEGRHGWLHALLLILTIE